MTEPFYIVSSIILDFPYITTPYSPSTHVILGSFAIESFNARLSKKVSEKRFHASLRLPSDFHARLRGSPSTHSHKRPFSESDCGSPRQPGQTPRNVIWGAAFRNRDPIQGNDQKDGITHGAERMLRGLKPIDLRVTHRGLNGFKRPLYHKT